MCCLSASAPWGRYMRGVSVGAEATGLAGWDRRDPKSLSELPAQPHSPSPTAPPTREKIKGDVIREPRHPGWRQRGGMEPAEPDGGHGRGGNGRMDGRTDRVAEFRVGGWGEVLGLAGSRTE